MDSLIGVASGDVRSQVHTGQPKRTRRTTGFYPERTSGILPGRFFRRRVAAMFENPALNLLTGAFIAGNVGVVITHRSVRIEFELL